MATAKTNVAAPKIGTSKRGDIVDKSLIDMPGPGLYDDEIRGLGK